MGRDRSYNRETRPSRRVWILSPSLANIHPSSGCSPNTKGEQIPGATETGRSYMREELRLSAQKLLKLPGRRNLQNSRRGQLRDYPSGSVYDQAKRPETQKPLKVKRELVKKRRSLRKRKRKRKRKRRRRRRRSKFKS